MENATLAGRRAYERRAWRDAFDALSQASAAGPLAADDIERLAWSAILTGHDEPALEAFERLHQLRLDAGEVPRAARAAFWLALRAMSLGQTARANGWLGRAERLVDPNREDCAECGYLRLPRIFRFFSAGDHAAAGTAAGEAATIGDRFKDPDLSALARDFQGRAMIRQGRLAEGLQCLDEAGTFDQASHRARLAHILAVPHHGCERVLRRREIVGGVLAQNRSRIGAEFRVDRCCVLIERHARRETPIDKRPPLVPVRAEQHGNPAEGAELEQVARLGGDVGSIDDGRPLRAPRFRYLFEEIRRARQQHLAGSLRAQARQHERSVAVRAAEGCRELLALRLCVGLVSQAKRKKAALHDGTMEQALAAW